MCNFCKALKESKKIEWSVRSTYADDNVCEKLFNEDCSKCDKCNKGEFTIASYSRRGEVRVCMEYRSQINDIITSPFTEPIQLNYCSNCGNKISDVSVDMIKNNPYLSIAEEG